MSIDKIKKECADMQAELETFMPDEINAVIERGKEIAVYHARTGYLLAMAKQMTRAKKTSEIGDTIIKIAQENYLSAKAQNALVESIAAEEMFLVDWLDRINSMCVHQLDFLRSIISKEKEEMRISHQFNYGNYRQ
ncbi:MAG: hypothetical protein LBL13_11545 [Bacteroidales bacterium]|jgi:aspartate/tyrosine/aromatic aminotransferase|nr:hypothetical protein [Bacteroidales bacterium]